MGEKGVRNQICIPLLFISYSNIGTSSPCSNACREELKSQPMHECRGGERTDEFCLCHMLVSNSMIERMD